LQAQALSQIAMSLLAPIMNMMKLMIPIPIKGAAVVNPPLSLSLILILIL
jgi:hypothetical protein